MDVLSPQTLRDFIKRYPESERVIRAWYKDLKKLEPRHFADLKTTFSSVDAVRLERYQITVFVFDVGGNKYRVMTRIDFEYRIGFILAIFTHPEYDDWNRLGRPI